MNSLLYVLLGAALVLALNLLRGRYTSFVAHERANCLRGCDLRPIRARK